MAQKPLSQEGASEMVPCFPRGLAAKESTRFWQLGRGRGGAGLRNKRGWRGTGSQAGAGVLWPRTQGGLLGLRKNSRALHAAGRRLAPADRAVLCHPPLFLQRPFQGSSGATSGANASSSGAFDVTALATSSLLGRYARLLPDLLPSAAPRGEWLSSTSAFAPLAGILGVLQGVSVPVALTSPHAKSLSNYLMRPEAAIEHVYHSLVLAHLLWLQAGGERQQCRAWPLWTFVICAQAAMCRDVEGAPSSRKADPRQTASWA